MDNNNYNNINPGWNSDGNWSTNVNSNPAPAPEHDASDEAATTVLSEDNNPFINNTNNNPYSSDNSYGSNNPYSSANPYSNNSFNNGNSYNSNPYNSNPYNNNSYNSNPYVNNNGFNGNNLNTNPNASKKGLAITALVIGILSVTICCSLGWLMGIIGLILGIISLASKRGGKGMAIAGIICSVLGILIGILMSVYLRAIVTSDGFWEAYTKTYNDIITEEGYPEYQLPDYSSESDDSYDSSDSSSEDDTSSSVYTQNDGTTYSTVIQPSTNTDNSVCQAHYWGPKQAGQDGSTIYFYEDGTFMWYENEASSKNYKSGKYSVCFGTDAMLKLTSDSDYAGYSVTVDSIESRFNDTDVLEDYTLLTLEVDQVSYDGDLSEDTYFVDYDGFTSTYGFQGQNLTSSDFVSFTPID